VKTTLEKEEAEAKLARIEDRVSDYNAKIRSLTDSNSKKLENLDGVVVSEEMKSKMRSALANIDQDELKDARTLKDSMSVLISHKLKKGVDSKLADENEEKVNISIDETVVMIAISDKLLVNSGSAVVSSKANSLIQRFADMIKSELDMEVRLEG